MSRNRNRRNSKRPMSQPPPTAILEEDSPPSSRVRRELQDSDSERTFSSEPSNTSAPMSGRASPPSSNLETDDKRVLIHVIGPETLHPIKAHRDIFDCVKKIFPEAYKSYNDAPQHMKQIWFNEFKKTYKWEQNDESRVREVFDIRAKQRFTDNLCDVRSKLREGKAPPIWMSEAVLAQYCSIWDTPEFKKKCEKNKKNRNSDCGGMGPSKHTGGSIPTREHRRRMQEEKGEVPSRAEVYIKTHTRKSDNTFICPKSKKVFEIVTHLQQTQPEEVEASIWLKAGGVQKGGHVYGFGSDTQYYFPESVKQKSKLVESSANTFNEDRMRKMEEELKTIKEALAQLSGNPIPNVHTPRSNQGSGVGLDDINTTNDKTPSPANVDVGDDANSENVNE